MPLRRKRSEGSTHCTSSNAGGSQLVHAENHKLAGILSRGGAAADFTTANCIPRKLVVSPDQSFLLD